MKICSIFACGGFSFVLLSNKQWIEGGHVGAPPAQTVYLVVGWNVLCNPVLVLLP